MVTRIVKQEIETIGFSKPQSTDNEQHISPAVKDRFIEFMHDKITQISFQLLDTYLEKLVKIVPVGDLEVVMVSLLTEKLAWKEESGRYRLIADLELKLYKKTNLIKVYESYFFKSNPKYTDQDVFIFFQLFHVFIHSAVLSCHTEVLELQNIYLHPDRDTRTQVLQRHHRVVRDMVQPKEL